MKVMVKNESANKEIIFQAEQEESWAGRIRRTLYYTKSKYVLTALKYARFKEFFQSLHIDYSVGWLIDNDGNLTRDVSKAFVFECNSIIDNQEYLDKPEHHHCYEMSDTRPQISFYKNGVYISVVLLKDAQDWLNSHPLPRKGISKMTRLNVYAKYNGRCAYCGCNIELNEMQVDHHIPHMGEGGEDTLDNYYPACSICNRVKSNSTLAGFKKSIKHCGEIHRARKKPIMADSDKIAIKYGLTEEDHDITFFFEEYDKTPKVDVENIKKVL